MPIEIDQVVTTATTVTTTPLVCDKLYILNLSIDSSGRDVTPPTASMEVIPYTVVNGANVFASESQLLRTNNLYAAIGSIPEVGAAIQAVFVAAGAWNAYRNARKVEMDSAQAAFNVAHQAWSDAEAAGTADMDTKKAASDAARVLADTARLAWADPANPKAV